MRQQANDLATKHGYHIVRDGEVAVQLYALHYRCLRLLVQNEARPANHVAKLSPRAVKLLKRAAFAALIDAEELEPTFVRVKRK